MISMGSVGGDQGRAQGSSGQPEDEDEVLRTLLDPGAQVQGLSPGLQQVLREQFVKQLGNMSTLVRENRELRAQVLRLEDTGAVSVGSGSAASGNRALGRSGMKKRSFDGPFSSK